MKDIFFKRIFYPLLVTISFLSLYSTFNSNQYTAVDGALRCVQVFRVSQPYIHGSDHMLYPIHVYLWFHFWRILGIEVQDVFQYISLIQRMNAFAAALSLGLFSLMLLHLTDSLKISIFGTLALGFSSAFIHHATNSAEPMVGFFLSLVALIISYAAVQQDRYVLYYLGSFFLVYAMATYQSMFAVFPGILIMIFVLLFDAGNRTRHIIKRLFTYTLFCLINIVILYGSAYYYLGDRSQFHSIARLFLPGFYVGSIYGGLSFDSLIGIAFGIIEALFYSKEWLQDASSLLEISMMQINIFTLVKIISYMVLAVLWISIFYFYKNNLQEIAVSSRNALLVVLSMVVFVLIPPFYFFPTYDKLWLQPLVFIITFLCLTTVAIEQRKSVPKKMLNITWFSFVGFLMLYNSYTVLIPSHFKPTQYLKEAREVGTIVSSQDLLVCGWDGVSLLVSNFEKSENTFIVPFVALVMKSDSKGLLSALEGRIMETRRAQGKVFFLGILDLNEQAWNAFLGHRLKHDYHLFDVYRERVKLIRAFRIDKECISLFEL